ncbi:MAG: methyltransferase domain-containing protein [Actinomycetota bacterium]|nr:methyltransferase domain-containing protein [Actinomycetota bacterium]
MTLEWDAAEYEVMSVPHVGWGVGLLRRALERPLRGDEAAIDAGCGTGKITELLLRHLPDGTVLAVDASAAMVEAARERFAGDGRVRVEQQDLVRLQVQRPVDLILSTATFHWIQDHERLFGRLVRALKPGGRLVVQCGGKGNIARMMGAAEEVMNRERFRDFFEGWEGPWNFADAETTGERLEAAGFEEVETWLQDEVTRFGSRDELARFLKTVVLGRHLERLPKSDHQLFTDAVAGKAAATEDALSIDYVRLNILATRRREL